MSLAQRKEIFRMTTSNGPAIAEMQAQIAQLQEQIRTHEVAIAELREKETELTRIFHRSRATNEDGIALVCPKIQVSNLDQRAGNAEAKLYRRN